MNYYIISSVGTSGEKGNCHHPLNFGTLITIYKSGGVAPPLGFSYLSAALAKIAIKCRSAIRNSIDFVHEIRKSK